MAQVAWYDVKAKGRVRDFVILLHPPYTMWHLAYVVIGAALAPMMNWGTLLWTLLAFFLAMGIGAHCLDELNGRPLKTKIPALVLILAAVISIGGAVVIGAIVGVRETVWVIPCIIFGGFIVFAYTMEWGPKGFFHRDEWFGFAWGAFPVITAYIAQTHTVSWGIIFVAGACLLYSLTQRVLSTQVRFFRRKVSMVEGHYFASENGPVVPGTVTWGQSHNLNKKIIIEPPETALKLMSWTVIAAAIGLVLTHI